MQKWKLWVCYSIFDCFCNILFSGELEDLQEVSRNKEGIDTLTYLQMTNPHLTVREIHKLQEEEDEKVVR